LRGLPSPPPPAPAMDPRPRGRLRDALDAVHAEAAAALGILWEAPWIAARNWRLSFPALFLVLIPSCLLSLCRQLLFDSPSSPARSQAVHARIPWRTAAAAVPSLSPRADGNLLVLADFGLLVAYWILDLFELTVTVFGAAAGYREDRPRAGDLLRRIRREWRGPVATQLCAAALRAGYWCLLDAFADALVPLAAGPTALLLMALGTLLYLAGNLGYYYLDAAWEAGPAAAAVDGCGGCRALGMAGEMTEGRWRMRGIVVGLVFVGVAEAAGLLLELLQLLGVEMAGGVRVGVVVGGGGVVEEVLDMYKIAAFTVLYCERRWSRLEEEQREHYYARLLPDPPPSS
ncbi:hypothetical protein Taro_022069, partial [Colocasia esculenta]|nr:hypothetical protein [Colocasia esculenta]